MQTYSHLLIAAILRRPLANRENHLATKPNRTPSFQSSAFLFGAVLPDLPLIITTLVCLMLDKLGGVSLKAPDSLVAGSYTQRLFNDWFFNNPWVIVEHNIFHSPTSLVLLLLGFWWLWTRGTPGASWLYWLMLGCLLHTACDIPVHHDDGPLVLFPFNWDYRYMSPISYWDPARYGRQFAMFEHLLDAVLIGCLCYRLRLWIKQMRQAKTPA